jgi:hypothetical protein
MLGNSATPGFATPLYCFHPYVASSQMLLASSSSLTSLSCNLCSACPRGCAGWLEAVPQLYAIPKSS